MVYISEGMQLQIPAGGLVLSLDGTTPPVQVVVRLDTWQHWLRIAGANTFESHEAHKLLLDAVATGDEAKKGTALQAEFQAAMVAISSAAFALDAFSATVKKRLPPLPDVEAAWRKNRTKRPARIAETLRRAFILGRLGQRLDKAVSEIFRFRDWAVHPPAEFQSPTRHPDLGVGVEWRFVAFSSSNAVVANRAAIDIVSRCLQLQSPNEKHAEIVDWVKFGTVVLEAIVEEFEAVHGPIASAGIRIRSNPTPRSRGSLAPPQRALGWAARFGHVHHFVPRASSSGRARVTPGEGAISAARLVTAWF